MGKTVPDPGEQSIPIESVEPVLPEQPKAEKEQPSPNKNDPAPERSGKVVDFAAARNEAEKTPKEEPGKQKTSEKDKAGKLNGDVIDGILSQEKKEVDKVIINSV